MKGKHNYFTYIDNTSDDNDKIMENLHKQIITKDVDTSACKFLRNDICASPINSNCKLCDEISEKMCYYKQLKRSEAQCEGMFVTHTDLEKKYKAKEQECEELKEDNKELQYQLRCTTGREKEWERNCKFWDARCEKLQTELDQLEAENKELKNLLKVRIEDLCDSCGASSMMPMPCKVYEKTLTEIKEIAEVLITITDEYDNCYHKSECDKCLLGINGDCQYFKVEQILQKISEVE